MSGFLQLQTTVGSREEAERIAEMLVQRRLAACVQILGPMVSVYRWAGAVEQGEEWLCLAKISASAFANVEAALHAEHSYDCPQMIALPIVEGSQSYLDWLAAELG